MLYESQQCNTLQFKVGERNDASGTRRRIQDTIHAKGVERLLGSWKVHLQGELYSDNIVV